MSKWSCFAQSKIIHQWNASLMQNLRSQHSSCRRQRRCGMLPWRHHPVSCMPERNRCREIQISWEQTRKHLISNNSASSALSYQRGPTGGGMSKDVNPLIHWAMNPSPTLRMYCSGRKMIEIVWKQHDCITELRFYLHPELFLINRVRHIFCLTLKQYIGIEVHFSRISLRFKSSKLKSRKKCRGFKYLCLATSNYSYITSANCL